MQTGRAVAACLDGGTLQGVREALKGAGFALEGAAASAGEALRMVRTIQPELLLADAVLPGGDAVWLAERLACTPMNVYPALLVMLPEGLNVPGIERLPVFGAATVGKPPCAAGIERALRQVPPDVLPPGKARRLEALLDALGVPAHPGRQVLVHAVGLGFRDRRRLDNLRDGIYPAAGAACGLSAAQAERAMRHVIDSAWRTGEIEQQQRIFGDTIDARRGRPTCGEMIAQLADILRWEG